MPRRRRGRAIDGILLLDKPPGLSSNRALQRARALLGAAKAGHTGSLDPLATGVLPLCFGEATKVSQYLLDADKAYESTFVLGADTTTGDAEGELTRTGAVDGIAGAPAIAAAMARFQGDIEQLPPMYSALKKDGKPLYELARQGIEVERAPRRVHIAAFELLALRSVAVHPGTGGPAFEVDVRVRCSKGTYIRSLAQDLGAALGCGGHVASLRRTCSGPFDIAQCVTLPALESLAASGDPQAALDLLLPAEQALADMPRVRLTESAGFYLRQGQPVLVPNAPCGGMVRVALESGEFLGVGEILDDGRVAPRRLMVAAR